MKALITGIEGFTGRYMADELYHAGYEVIGLSRQLHKMKSANVSAIYVCDLCDSVSLTRIVQEIQPDIVVHLAAISFVPHGDTAEIYRVNLIGSRNLLDAVSQTCISVKAVLIASSASIYGNATGGLLDESTSPDPCNDYAVSKLAMEYAAKLYEDRLPIIITRPFNYTGVGHAVQFLLPKIISHVQRGASVIELGNLEVTRDFSDVRVVVQYYRRLIESTRSGNLRGEVFNICTGRAYTLAQILATITEISGHCFEIKINPALERVNEVKVLIGNPSKLLAHVGSVTDISLSDTLRWMLNTIAE
ncbi:MAG: GDP-mannose 4,6 dehydratase [Solimicrobium sp.]|nr:GDP-mannose 4,6 dehydratase [Solimicrobium sp.]